MENLVEPKVGIILINYNGYFDTKECLNSLLNMDYQNKTIYIVDNCSPDNSGEQLNEYINSLQNEYIKLIRVKENLGFTGGNNLGIELALKEGMEYIWLVNNDTIVEKSCLKELVKRVILNPEFGFLSSRIYYYGSNEWWFIGGEISKYGHVKQISNEKEIIGSEGAAYYETDYITGCSMFINRQLIEEIGLLNEDYFMYFEDTEWCIRARKKGWKVGCVTDSIMWHKVSASTSSKKNDSSPLKQYYQLRNHFYIINLLFSKKHKVIPYMIRYYWIFRRCLSILLKYRTNAKMKYESLFKAVYHATIGKKGNSFN